MAIAVARHVGARFIVGTDISAQRLELARGMGADFTVDVSQHDIHEAQKALGMREGFDVGFEMSGAPTALPSMIENMNHGGRIAMLGLPSKQIAVDWGIVVTHMLTLKGIYGREMFETWYAMSVLLESGLDISGVITDRFPHTDHEAAFRAARSGHGGKVIMTWGEW
jgi:threonine 3-dehydrogenase